jgi:hypothetical protein
MAKVPAAATGTHPVCGDQTSIGRLPRPALGNTDRAGPGHQVGRSGPPDATWSKSLRRASSRSGPSAASHSRRVSVIAASAAWVQAQPFSVSTINRALDAIYRPGTGLGSSEAQNPRRLQRRHPNPGLSYGGSGAAVAPSGCHILSSGCISDGWSWPARGQIPDPAGPGTVSGHRPMSVSKSTYEPCTRLWTAVQTTSEIDTW